MNRTAALALLAPFTAAFAQAPAPMVDGEIRAVNTAAGTATIRHAEIPNLSMGAMTMVFEATDPAQLDGLKAGDKVRFAAEMKGGTLVLVKLERAAQ